MHSGKVQDKLLTDQLHHQSSQLQQIQHWHLCRAQLNVLSWDPNLGTCSMTCLKPTTRSIALRKTSFKWVSCHIRLIPVMKHAKALIYVTTSKYLSLSVVCWWLGLKKSISEREYRGMDFCSNSWIQGSRPRMSPFIGPWPMMMSLRDSSNCSHGTLP